MLLMVLIGFALPAALLCVPIALVCEEQAEWSDWEVLLPAILFFPWLLLLLVTSGKSLANWVEAPILGVIAGVLCGMRVWLAPRVGARRAARTIALVALVAGPSLYFLMPSLPE